MQFTISTTDLTEMVLENKFPENYYDTSCGITERIMQIENVFGNGIYHETFFEGIHIAYGDLKFKEKTKLIFESNYETIEMHFELCGKSCSKIEGTESTLFEFATNRHNIVYAPEIKGSIDFNMHTSRMLEINITPAVFKKYVQGFDTYNHFLSHIKNQSPALLGKHNMPITPAMMHIINTIINCTKKGIFKRIFLEAKVIELLLLQLEQFAAHDCKVFCSVKPADMEKMYHAKEIILKQLHNPCSLIDLARQVGTNEFTLKKGFKEVFGTTVFGMVSEVRMEQAKQLLLSGEKNISEISDLTGYSHQAHFTKAFKKKFGVPPSNYLK